MSSGDAASAPPTAPGSRASYWPGGMRAATLRRAAPTDETARDKPISSWESNSSSRKSRMDGSSGHRYIAAQFACDCCVPSAPPAPRMSRHRAVLARRRRAFFGWKRTAPFRVSIAARTLSSPPGSRISMPSVASPSRPSAAHPAAHGARRSGRMETAAMAPSRALDMAASTARPLGCSVRRICGRLSGLGTAPSRAAPARMFDAACAECGGTPASLPPVRRAAGLLQQLLPVESLRPAFHSPDNGLISGGSLAAPLLAVGTPSGRPQEEEGPWSACFFPPAAWRTFDPSSSPWSWH